MSKLVRNSLALAAALASFATMGCGGGDAAPASSAPSAQESSGGEEPLSLEAFTAAVAAAVVPELCASESWMRQCFPSVTEEQCQQVLGAALTACSESMAPDLPATVSEEDAERVGGALGECAAVAYAGGLRQAGVEVAGECASESATTPE